MQPVNQPSISARATDPTSTSREHTGKKDTGVTDAEMLSAGYAMMRELAKRFGGFQVRFNTYTGKVTGFDMNDGVLYYCRECKDFKLASSMLSHGALCKAHASSEVKK